MPLLNTSERRQTFLNFPLKETLLFRGRREGNAFTMFRFTCGFVWKRPLGRQIASIEGRGQARRCLRSLIPCLVPRVAISGRAICICSTSEPINRIWPESYDFEQLRISKPVYWRSKEIGGVRGPPKSQSQSQSRPHPTNLERPLYPKRPGHSGTLLPAEAKV
jgi:hypothetical protein